MPAAGRVAKTSLIPTSMTERAVQFIRQKSVARSDEIERALGLSNVAALLATRVLAGDLVACKVTIPGRKRQVNEYRISAAAGMPRTGTSPWRGEPEGKKPPRALSLSAPAEPIFTHSIPGSEIAGTAVGPGTKFVGAIQNDVPMPEHSRVMNPDLLARMSELAQKEVGMSFVTAFRANHCYRVAKRVGIKVMCGREGDHVRVWRRE